MRICLAAALALLPLPVLAEDYDCRLLLSCATQGGGCSETAPDEAMVLHLAIAAGSKTATLSGGGDRLKLSLIDTSAAGRSFLARRGGESLGILTLRPDGALAASSHELIDGALVGVTGTGTCLPRNG